MKRRDELVVGVTVFAALVLVVAGTLWLSQADLARAWRRVLGAVDSWTDLEPELLGRVEELIDFVTAP